MQDTLTQPPAPVPPFDGSTCSEGHPACDMACTGCGRCDPCGVHFTDCKWLEDGDWVITREQPHNDYAVIWEG